MYVCMYVCMCMCTNEKVKKRVPGILRYIHIVSMGKSTEDISLTERNKVQLKKEV